MTKRSLTEWVIFKKFDDVPFPGEWWDSSASSSLEQAQKLLDRHYCKENFRVVKITYSLPRKTKHKEQ